MNRKIKWITACALICQSFFLYAQSESTDKDKVGLFVRGDNECPFKTEQLERIAEGELLRSRIHIAKNDSDYSLHVTVKCLESRTRGDRALGYAVSSQIYFGFDGKLINVDYGTIMSTGNNDSESSQFILNSVRNSISEAITDYIKFVLMDNTHEN